MTSREENFPTFPLTPARAMLSPSIFALESPLTDYPPGIKKDSYRISSKSSF